jgi:membrane-bound metal-dependent hydrolase YbcI (DUF457 family)
MAGVATWWAWWTSPWSVAILVAASFFLVFRMLLPMVIRHMPFVSIASAVLMFSSSDWAYHLAKHATSGKWLIVAVVGGVISHLVCDSLTIEGVPWLWLPMIHPLQRFHIKFPLVGHTGSARESLIGSLMALALVWMTWHMILVPGAHDMTRIVAHALPHFNPVGWVKSWLPHLHVPKPGQIVKTVTH